MLIVGNALISEDILEKKFVCHLEKCKGACCVAGDRGAPLVEEEIDLLKNDLEAIRLFMDEEGLDLLTEKGFYETDPADGELVTLLDEAPVVEGGLRWWHIQTADGSQGWAVDRIGVERTLAPAREFPNR